MRFLLTFVLMLSSGANTQELIRVIAVEYPPFLTSESQSFGTSFILLKQYADSHLKISYEPMFVPPGRAQYIIEHGEWCMSFYPPKPHDKKARFVLLSPNNVKLGLYRIAKNEPFHYRSLSELQGSVAVLRSTNLGQIHKILEDTDLELVHVETVEQGIGMLLAGRVDYAFGDNTTTDTYTEIKNINKLQFSEIPLTEAKVGFYYNIDCEEAIYKTKP